METVAKLPLPTFDDGLRAVLILADGACKPTTFAGRLAECRRRRFVPARWKPRAGDGLSRETLAYMVCKVCGIKGGVNWYLFGIRRYALREAVYRGLMDPGAGYQFVSGPELLDVLNRATRYMARHDRGSSVAAGGLTAPEQRPVKQVPGR